MKNAKAAAALAEVYVPPPPRSEDASEESSLFSSDPETSSEEGDEHADSAGMKHGAILEEDEGSSGRDRAREIYDSHFAFYFTLRSTSRSRITAAHEINYYCAFSNMFVRRFVHSSKYLFIFNSCLHIKLFKIMFSFSVYPYLLQVII